MVSVETSPNSRRYTFRSKPCVANSSGTLDRYRLKFDEAPKWHGNIMHDRRVVRGNTYAAESIPVEARDNPIELQRRQEAKRREMSRKRALKGLRLGTPPPVAGRRHVFIQTEKLFDFMNNLIEEKEAETQTDQLLDKPPSPLFVRAISGEDKSTQIKDGDLFHFDEEVQPVLQVMVVKIREQAIIEVLEEEELAMLRQQQREFEEFRNADLIEEQRLEEQDRRLREEKERRIKQEHKVIKKRKDAEDKIAARVFAKNYAQSLVPSVMDDLKSKGFFNDPVSCDIFKEFMPKLMDDVAGDLSSKLSHLSEPRDVIFKMSGTERSQLSGLLLDIILRKVINAKHKDYDGLKIGVNGLKLAEPKFQYNVETVNDKKSVTTIESVHGITHFSLQKNNTSEEEESAKKTEDRKSGNQKPKISFEIDEELLSQASEQSTGTVFDGTPGQRTGDEYVDTYEEVHVYEDPKDAIGTISEVPKEEDEEK